jgi:hypothetical protein
VQPAYVTLTVRRSTVLGEVEVRELPLAENSIFRDKLMVHNRQGGIIRYSYLPGDSRTPRRFRCQYDGLNFVQVRYGTSDYCRLDDTYPNAEKILEGGEYSGEMGVYYHLFDPVRTTILQKRLNEYLPIGVEAQVFFVT